MSTAAMADNAARNKNDFDILFIEGLRAFRAWISVWRIGPRKLAKVPDAWSVSQVECRGRGVPFKRDPSMTDHKKRWSVPPFHAKRPSCARMHKAEPYATRQYISSPLFGGMARHTVRIHAQMAVVPAGGRGASCGHHQKVGGGEPDRGGAGAHPGLSYPGGRQPRSHRDGAHEYLRHVRIHRPAGRRVPDPCRAARLHGGAVRPEELAGGRPAGGTGAGPAHPSQHFPAAP